MPTDEWRRLGRLLIERRVRIGYTNRTEFCRATRLNSKLVQDVEKARRDNFTAPTIASLEIGYQWEHGSIDRVLAGGDPVPAAVDVSTRPVDVRLPARHSGYPGWVGDDPFLRHIWDFTAASEEERRFAGHAVLLSRILAGTERPS